MGAPQDQNPVRMAASADVIIVGGGVAGLSAALVLGRCRRRVVVYDHGQPRNRRSERLSGFLSRDGLPPRELSRIAREQLGQYDTVQLRDAEVIDAARLDDGFEVVLQDGARQRGRKLLLATGVADELPAIDGIDAFYGTSVWHCPICDGWEHRDQPLAVVGTGKAVEKLALELLNWSRDLAVCSNGQRGPTRGARALLERHGIRVYDTPIVRLEGDDGQLRALHFASGERLERSGMFFTGPQLQRSNLVSKLGCELTRKGAVRTGDYETTDVPGLFVAGDASRLVRLAIVAAAEGALAGCAINAELNREALMR
jgi:thioredoxin reductase